MDYYFLPQDLIDDIFRRIPTAAAAVRFRCVCKSWNRLLSDPKFIHNQLFFSEPAVEIQTRIAMTRKRDIHTPIFSLLSYDCETLLPITPYDDRNNCLGYRDLPGLLGTSYAKIIGCCNGLFCIVTMLVRDDNHHLIIWNPSTSETKLLPNSQYEYSHYYIGFGFDARTGDYKVVRVLDSIPSSTEIYSLKNESWSQVVNANANDHFEESFYVNRVARMHPSSSCGKIYWYRECGDLFFTITCFDIREEKFSHQRFPTSLSARAPNLSARAPKYDRVNLTTTSKEDSLVAVVEDSYLRHFEIWSLLRFQSVESWTKLFHCPMSRILSSIDTRRYRVIDSVLGNGEYILITNTNKLLIFDFLNEKVSNYNGIRAAELEVPQYLIFNLRVDAYSYIPSLVSINSINGDCL
ncbi:F-box/kelch-repeat protein At3g06240 [Linum grandiflorum]